MTDNRLSVFMPGQGDVTRRAFHALTALPAPQDRREAPQVEKQDDLASGIQRRLDALNTVMQENLAGVRVVKAFVRTRHERQRFQRANDDLMTQTIKAIP